jgi:hypothetical protein
MTCAPGSRDGSWLRRPNQAVVRPPRSGRGKPHGRRNRGRRVGRTTRRRRHSARVISAGIVQSTTTNERARICAEIGGPVFMGTSLLPRAPTRVGGSLARLPSRRSSAAGGRQLSAVADRGAAVEASARAPRSARTSGMRSPGRQLHKSRPQPMSSRHEPIYGWWSCRRARRIRRRAARRCLRLALFRSRVRLSRGIVHYRPITVSGRALIPAGGGVS